ncbi:hypothetical protein AOG28_15005 [Cobetia sp. UCD-24C]|nr:hypothetical protein AOG28_15005 [Cobetia sp. UCD-24C]
MCFVISSFITSIGHLKSKRFRGRIFSSKAMDELFAQLPNRQCTDGGVNCLATDVGDFKFRQVHVSQLAGDLLWRQVALKKVLNKPEPLAIDG